jgi:hypothetical protein
MTELPEKPGNNVSEEPCATREEQTYDLIIPPGIPRQIIANIAESYDVEVVERSTRLDFANMDGIERNLLAFRGRKETMLEVEQEMRRQVLAFIYEE